MRSSSRRRLRPLGRALLGLGLLACSWQLDVGSAGAQLPDPPASPSDADVERARSEFLEGMQHARAERLAEALACFERSYELSGSPVALFNIGSTFRSLSRFREATEAFARLLADPALDEPTRREALQLHAEVGTRVAVVTVRGVPEGPAEVLADGSARETTRARPIEIPLDPGLHVLSVELPDRVALRWSGEVADGARFDLEARSENVISPTPDEGSTDPLAWILLGVGVGAVVAAVAIGVAADQAAQLGPRSPYVIELP